MARESALWQRVKGGGKHLRACGHGVHFCRIENEASAGHPDVDGCVNGVEIWLELKSEDRPARANTPIRPKLRNSQSIWHRERSQAGCVHNFVLLQVGSNRDARLYLIPGSLYDSIAALNEAELQCISVCDPLASIAEVLMRATEGY